MKSRGNGDKNAGFFFLTRELKLLALVSIRKGRAELCSERKHIYSLYK